MSKLSLRPSIGTGIVGVKQYFEKEIPLDEAEIDQDFNFRRALHMLEKKIKDSGDLVTYWMVTKCEGKGPWPERSAPWYEGFQGKLNKTIE